MEFQDHLQDIQALVRPSTEGIWDLNHKEQELKDEIAAITEPKKVFIYFMDVCESLYCAAAAYSRKLQGGDGPDLSAAICADARQKRFEQMKHRFQVAKHRPSLRGQRRGSTVRCPLLAAPGPPNSSAECAEVDFDTGGQRSAEIADSKGLMAVQEAPKSSETSDSSGCESSVVYLGAKEGSVWTGVSTIDMDSFRPRPPAIGVFYEFNFTDKEFLAYFAWYDRHRALCERLRKKKFRGKIAFCEEGFFYRIEPVEFFPPTSERLCAPFEPRISFLSTVGFPSINSPPGAVKTTENRPSVASDETRPSVEIRGSLRPSAMKSTDRWSTAAQPSITHPFLD